MTVDDLARRTGRSVADLVQFAFGSNAAAADEPVRTGRRGRPPGSGAKRGRPPGRKPGRPAAAAAGKKGGEVDTRAAASRGKFDEAVLGAVRGSKGRVKAAELRKKVGGSSLQMRAALHRLIEDGKIKSQGKARGTTYSA